MLCFHSIFLFFFFFLPKILITFPQNARIVKLADFVENSSYLPIRKNDQFILEVEGNPTTGYKWYLENAELVAKNKILFPLNLDNNGSGVFFNSSKEKNLINGIYHFHFLAKQQGNEKLVFSTIYRIIVFDKIKDIYLY
jgi:predicted secreted protein